MMEKEAMRMQGVMMAGMEVSCLAELKLLYALLSVRWGCRNDLTLLVFPPVS